MVTDAAQRTNIRSGDCSNTGCMERPSAGFRIRSGRCSCTRLLPTVAGLARTKALCCRFRKSKAFLIGMGQAKSGSYQPQTIRFCSIWLVARETASRTQSGDSAMARAVAGRATLRSIQAMTLLQAVSLSSSIIGAMPAHATAAMSAME